MVILKNQNLELGSWKCHPCFSCFFSAITIDYNIDLTNSTTLFALGWINNCIHKFHDSLFSYSNTLIN